MGAWQEGKCVSLLNNLKKTEVCIFSVSQDPVRDIKRYEMHSKVQGDFAEN